MRLKKRYILCHIERTGSSSAFSLTESSIAKAIRVLPVFVFLILRNSWNAISVLLSLFPNMACCLVLCSSRF